MRTAINKKRIVLYAVCAFFFCLAGVFQAVDSSLPGAHDTDFSRGGVGHFSYT